MSKKDKEFKEATQELNQKIESIMGPTQTGEKPVDDKKPTPTAVPPVVEKPAEPTETEQAPTIESTEAPVEAEPNAAKSPKTDDKELDDAVDNIANEESDKALQIEDAVKAMQEKPPKKSFGQKIKDFFKAWWNNPKARNATLVLFALIIIGLAVFPTTRYFFLNLVGVRSQASVTVLDASTQQPLKNVQVTVANQTGKTNDDGYVKLEKVKLGKTKLNIKKRAFAPVDKQITVGWGSNPQGETQLQPAGVQYTFYVKDFLSDKPVEKAEATSGESGAFADKDGKIVLTLDKEDTDATTVKIKAKSYREEELPLSENNEEVVNLKLVPSHKHAFVSKRSGKYDVYKIYVDGSHEEVALAGTGAEREDMVLAPHSTENIVAVVSTRENQRNKDGFLMSSLNLVNLDDDKVNTIGKSEQIEVVGWTDTHFVYVQISEGASASNPKRHRLMSFDLKKEETKELASANYFNDVTLISNVVYYAPSSAYQNGSDTSLFKINPDGNNKQVVFNKEVWNIFRTSYEKITFAVQQDWYEYTIGSTSAPNRITPPPNPKTRVYISNPANKRSIWIDDRDGKGVMIMYKVDDKQEETLRTQSGLKYPVSWVSDSTLVYRINTDQETADYVLNVDGGEPRKIKDVTNTGGVDKWYYY